MRFTDDGARLWLLAYGTETIALVDKITGPNAFVAAAKRRVFGKVYRHDRRACDMATMIPIGSRSTCSARPNMMKAHNRF